MGLRLTRHILIWGIYGLTLGCLAANSQASNTHAPICPNQLGQSIESIIDQSQFQRGRWGLFIQGLGNPSRRPLYARDHQKLFIAASNAKLLTTAVALEMLGPQFQIQTDFVGLGTGPTLKYLRIIGRGDPSLTDAKLEQIARQLRQQGVRHIEQLIGDDRAFQGPPVVPSWEWEDLQVGYGAPVNSLILNQNQTPLNLEPQAVGQPLRAEWALPESGYPLVLENRSRTVNASKPEWIDVTRNLEGSVLEITGQLRVGAEPERINVAIPNPGWYFINRFRNILATHQITVDGTSLLTKDSAEDRSFRAHPSERLIAVLKSPHLSELIIETNQDSNNLYAEVLLRALAFSEGVRTSQVQARTTTLAQSLVLLKHTLTGWTVDPSGYVLSGGSGLSRHSGISPETLVHVLTYMDQSKHREIYRASLASVGKGTLKHRFVNTPAQGILYAKTGTMRGVVALSGYLDSPTFSPLVFSIVVNQANQSIAQLRNAIDEIVVLLARLQSC